MAQVLFLTQVLPFPLDAGPKIRAYHVLCHLATDHQVTLVSFVRPDDTPKAIEHLKGICHAVYPIAMRRSLGRNLRAGAKGLLTGQPMVIARDEIGEMTTTLQRLMVQNTFDVVHADQLSMAGYGQLAVRMARQRRPRALLDEHNAIHLLVRRMAATETNVVRRAIAAREARAFARYEARMCWAYDEVLTVTREDREHLLALYRPNRRQRMAQKFTVVPICVDPDQVQPIAYCNDHGPTILHVGTMFWPPNVTGVLWFAREVLPLIHRERPEAHFVIVGKNPPPEIQALADDPRIQVTGYAADPQPYLQTADAFIVPLHAGGGMRVKILDAWLWGLPIVSTPLGAEGIDYQNEKNILVAGDAPAFARATLRLLTDRDLNRQMRRNGRAWVETQYAWHTVYLQLDEIYARLLDKNRVQD